MGHINPTIPVGAELSRRGHEVAWCGYPDPLATLLPAGASLVPVAEDVPVALREAAIGSLGLRGAAALKFLWEGFIIPLARAMVPGVEAAVQRWRPDALLVDQQALAGAVVARRRRLAWATSATTSGELVDSLAQLPKVREWIIAQQEQLQTDYGISPPRARGVDLSFSERLLVAFTTADLAAPGRELPDHWVFVGAAAEGRPEPVPFPWEALQDKPRLLISLGTVNAGVGGRFYASVVGALSSLAVQGIITAPPELVGEVPANVLVSERVPQLALLPEVDAVVCHAGHNTVCEALTHGLPLVVAPIRDDQPIVADQVARAGAGIRVKFGRAGQEELRAAMAGVLDDPAYRRAARRLGESLRRAGGARVAADHLEVLGPARGGRGAA